MNSDLSDIASGLSSVVTNDGQSSITAPIKFAHGSQGAPAISFVSDTNSGIWRIGADEIGIGVNATKILDIATTGLGISGTLGVNGQILPADGTVLLPEYSFASDPTAGVYHIAANNIGVAINAIKVLDISAAGLNVIGTVSANGAVLAGIAANSIMVNGTVVETHAANAATFAIKTLAGVDPSSGDPVYFIFRNTTAATGNYTVIAVTAALSVVASSGSTLGFVNGVPAKVWLVAFNDAGTVRLGIINCETGTNIYPLAQFPLASSTAEGGVGGADSSAVFYTGTAVTSKAYVPVAYASYETGLATAGSWAASPTRIMLYGPNVPLPGAILQTQKNITGAVATGTTVIPNDDTIPQNTEGDQYMTQAITPTSATNILVVEAAPVITNSTSSQVSLALFQDSIAGALAAKGGNQVGNKLISEPIYYEELVGSTVGTSATTFKIRAGGEVAGTTTFNGSAGGRIFGGVMNSYLKVTEIMT